jgi:hypothetical protein
MEVRQENKRRERQWRAVNKGNVGDGGSQAKAEPAVDEVLTTVLSQHRCRDFTRQFTHSSEGPCMSYRLSPAPGIQNAPLSSSRQFIYFPSYKHFYIWSGDLIMRYQG